MTTPGEVRAAPLVVGNDWSALVPSDDERWTPTRVVSVCIPTRNPGPGLARTIRCLGAQTYPSELVEIIVADDGSDTPISLPDDLDRRVKVVRQERTLGFGAGRARNLAGRAASGDVLFFLDADVIPERQVIESYARWFERCELAVPMGFCRFVDVDDVETNELVDLVAAGSMGQRFDGRDVDDQSWRERHFERLDDLQVEALDAFRVTIGATLAVSAAQFRTVGGFPELGVRGVEDTAFGYRVHNNGGVLIFDRDAAHWHQGRRNLSTQRRHEIDQVRAPYVQSVIPVRGFRRGEPPTDPPVEPSPILRVRVRGEGPDAEGTRRSVAADPSANVVLSDDDLTLAEAARRYDDAFAQVDLPAGLRWSPAVTQHLLDLFATRNIGAVRAVHDGGTSAGVVVELVRTRALRRAAQVRPDEDPVVVASRLFGVWWVDARTLGIVAESDSDDTECDRGPSSSGVGARVHGLLERRPRVGLWSYRRMRAVLRWAAR